jgi:hypothetical protein
VSDSLKLPGGSHDQIPRTIIPRISLRRWNFCAPPGANDRTFVFAWLGAIAFIVALGTILFYVIPFLYFRH